MPFTVSHAAAAAPLWPLVRRGHLPLAALAVGAMSPDFEYFLHLRTLALWSHSPLGLVAFCLPAGLLVLAAWELVARAPVRHLLALDAEPRPAPRDRRWWGRAAVAVVVGAATHVVWDSVTHPGYWVVRHVPALRVPTVSLGARPMPLFTLLDHLSTVVGGIAVVAWLGREMRRAGAWRVLGRSPWRWGALLALVGVALAAGLWNGTHPSVAAGAWRSQLWVARVAVGAMLGFGLALLALGVAHRAGDYHRRELH